ncbi:MAG: hypothetical protein ACREN6_12765 [Gemmatimonadaceae bacterium]
MRIVVPDEVAEERGPVRREGDREQEQAAPRIGGTAGRAGGLCRLLVRVGRDGGLRETRGSVLRYYIAAAPTMERL